MDLKSSIPSGHLVHPKQIGDIIAQAGAHGKLHEGDGHVGLCREGWAYTGGLLLQVQGKLAPGMWAG